jgi:kynureninase
MGSRLRVQQIKNEAPLPYQDDSRAFTREYAASLDAEDPLRHFRDEFIIPSVKDLKRKTLDPSNGELPCWVQGGLMLTMRYSF